MGSEQGGSADQTSSRRQDTNFLHFFCMCVCMLMCVRIGTAVCMGVRGQGTFSQQGLCRASGLCSGGLPSPLVLTQHGKQTGARGHLNLFCLGVLMPSPGQRLGKPPCHSQPKIGPKHVSVHHDYVVFNLQQVAAVR